MEHNALYKFVLFILINVLIRIPFLFIHYIHNKLATRIVESSVKSHGRYNYILLCACCVIAVGATMDMLGYSVVVPAASCDLDLTLEQGGIIKSISFAGFLFAIPWGYTADNIGRKKTILIAITTGFVFSALASFSVSYSMMLVLKFLSSCFSTAAMTLTTTYLGESTCKKKRTKFIFIQNISSVGCDFLVYVLAYLILPLNLTMSVPYTSIKVFKSWRLLSLIMSLPLGIGAVLIAFLNETPKFYAAKRKNDNAMAILNDIFKINNGKSQIYSIKSICEEEEFSDEKDSCCSFLMIQLKLIWKPPLLWRSLQLMLILSICCSTNNIFFMWFPTMVNSYFTSTGVNNTFCEKIVANITPVKLNDVCVENYPMNTLYAGMILTFVSTLLSIGALVLVNRRRFMIITFLLIASISCAIVNMVHNQMISIILFSIVQFTVLAIGYVYSYYVDIFPTSCRGLGTGIGMTVARMVCLGGIALVGTTVINYCELSFYCFAVFIASGIVAAVFLPK